METNRGSKSYLVPMDSQEAVYECINSGIYGQFQKSKAEKTSHHMKIVADYANTRPGDHVFMFCDRRIYYAGRIQENNTGGSVLLNGTDTPLDLQTPTYTHIPDRQADDTDPTGRFTQAGQHGEQVRCQPYLFAFTKANGLAGRAIPSDALYNRLARREFSAPSAQMENVGFCGLSPGETKLLLRLFGECSETTSCSPPTTVDVSDFKSVSLTSQYSIQNAGYESGIEALLMSEPYRLPSHSRQSGEMALRQVPFSSQRPTVDRVDIGLYEPGSFFPSKIYEIKRDKAQKDDAEQVARYYQYAAQCEECDVPEIWILASGFVKKFDDYLSHEEYHSINKRTYSENNSTLSQFISNVTYPTV